MNLNGDIVLQMFLKIQMINNFISKYLLQTQDLFGDSLYFKNQIVTSNFYKFGNIDSNLIFIKRFSSDIVQETIFLNILKALNLSTNQILVVDVLNPKIKIDKSLESLLNSKIIITLGLEVSQFLLNTHDDLELLRTKNNIFFNSKVISTYSLSDMINNPDLKKYVWNDLKVIL